MFIDGFNGKRMFLSKEWTASDALRLYTDAASTKGFAAGFGTQWCSDGRKSFRMFIETFLSFFL